MNDPRPETARKHRFTVIPVKAETHKSLFLMLMALAQLVYDCEKICHPFGLEHRERS